MLCRYIRASVQCQRQARDNWTTCNRHYSAGMNRTTWHRIQRDKEATKK